MSPSDEMTPAATARSSEVSSTRIRAAAPRRVRRSGRRGALSVLAGIAAFGFAGMYIVPAAAALTDSAPETTAALTAYAVAADDAQSVTVDAAVAGLIPQRESYEVYVKPKPPPPPPTPTRSSSSSSGSSTASAARPFYSGGGSKTDWLIAAGIPESDWGYVDYIVQRESGWNPNATNRSSGACGLVQALPCSKVPGNGYDPVDNLRWANGYAHGRYGSWAAAYQFWISRHWW